MLIAMQPEVKKSYSEPCSQRSKSHTYGRGARAQKAILIAM